jgi:serine/threonine protein kinase/formylglycine-generating enzyme required for sulfatase activity
MDQEQVDELFDRLVELSATEQTKILTDESVSESVRDKVMQLIAADREARTKFLKPLLTGISEKDQTKALGHASPLAARTVLHSVLAVQLGFISKEQSALVIQRWAANRSQSAADAINSVAGHLEDEHELLNALVEKMLSRHGGDAIASLAALSGDDSWIHDLSVDASEDINACIRIIGASAAPRAVSGKSGGSRYRVLRPHARGGLGEVFVAYDEELSRDVALKEIQEHAGSAENQKRFMREAQITGNLEHPGIVPIYGLGTYDDGRPYYAMRFVHGDSLKSAIKQFHSTPLSDADRAVRFRELLQRFVDVCNAIHYAHSRGVLHRDLKPGNIMLGEFGETLVVDWGLARLMSEPEDSDTTSALPEGVADSATQTGQIVGTLAFMSPEQAAGKTNELGVASDVYSLGATLYTLLTGKNAFTIDDLQSGLTAIREGRFRGPREIERSLPKPLEAICLQAMKLEPTERYESAAELRDDLNRYLADEAVTAHREPIHQRASRWVRRHKTLATSLLLSGVLIASAGFGYSKIQQRAAARELTQTVDSVVDNVLTADFAEVPAVAKLPEELRAPVSTSLEERLITADKQQILRVNLARLDRAADREAVLAQLTQLPVNSLVGLSPLLQKQADFFKVRLWDLARKQKEFSDLQRRRALAVLAQIDSDSAEWTKEQESLASVCTSAPVEAAQLWFDALKPILGRLDKQLQQLSTNAPTDQQKLVALRFIANTAAPKDLVKLAISIPPKQVSEVVEPIRAKIEQCRPLLMQAMNQPPLRKPMIAIPRQKVADAPQEIHEEVGQYVGMVADTFAFAQAVPENAVLPLVQKLKQFGYRPVSVRPFRRTADVAASIVWHRDARQFELVLGRTEEDFVAAVERLKKIESLAPLDVTMYQDTEGEIQFAGVWEEKLPGSPKRTIEPVMATPEVLNIFRNVRVKEGLSLFRYAEGMDRVGRLYCAVIFEQTKRMVVRDAFDEHDTYKGLCLSGDYTDLRLYPMWSWTVPVYADLISDGTALLKSSDPAEQQQGLVKLAAGHHNFGNLEEAKDACRKLLELNPGRKNETKRLALLYAAMGEEAKADEMVAAFSDGQPALQSNLLKLRVAAQQGKALPLDAVQTSLLNTNEPAEILTGVNAVLDAAGFRTVEAEDASALKSLATKLLAKLRTTVKKASLKQQFEPRRDLYSAISQPAIAAAVSDIGVPRRIDGVYRIGSECESRIIAPTANLLDECRQLAAAGFVPVLMNGYQSGDAEYPVGNAVWTRYYPTYEESVQQEKEIGNAKAILLTTGEVDWETLNNGMETSTVETLHFLNPTVPTLMAQYDSARPDSDTRCNFLTLLGFMDEPEDRTEEWDQFAKKLLKEYPNTSNNRLAGCIEWCLRKHGFEDELNAVVDSMKIQDSSVSDQLWYINTLGQRMVRVEPGEIIVGGRPNEEPLHNVYDTLSLARVRTRTHAPYYVCATEMTFAQFREFAVERGVNIASNISDFVPTDECAMSSPTLMQMAGFCNWLSQRAGIPENQWCYLPNEAGQYDVGMKPAPQFKTKIGYRLPDGVEWEFAARAGTTTISYWGDGSNDRYLHAQSLKTVRPGMYPPNPFGLFDICGNAAERTQERYTLKSHFAGGFAVWQAGRTDESPWLKGQPFVDRGSFGRPISYAWPNPCSLRNPGLGLRVVRSALLAASPEKSAPDGS